MTRSKRWSRSKFPALVGLGGLLVCMSQDAFTELGSPTVAKALLGPPGGVALQGGDYTVNFTWGEPLSGETLMDSQGTVESGYYGARFGAGQDFVVADTEVGSQPAYFQSGLQVGV